MQNAGEQPAGAGIPRGPHATDGGSATATAAPLDPDALRAFAAAVYRSAGVPDEDAALAADTLVQADLWGHQSHGMLRLGWYYARLRSGAMKARTACRIAVDGGAVAVLDGADGVGQVVARRATDEAVRRAREHGVAVVSVRNSNHFGTCMYYTRIGAQAGCVTMLMSNAGPNMAPWGGLKKKIGTNPWSIAAPAGGRPPIVMDMANSGVARGKIYLANNRHESIPSHWAIDKHGNPTTDPAAALEGFILPMAGHKGYVMGVMIDVLSGVLSGSEFLDGVHGPYDPVNRSGAGHFMLAVNVGALMPPEEFGARMDAYIASLKDVPVAPGHEQVYYPGEMEAQADQRNRAAGLFLAPETLADLARVGAEAGVPWDDYFAVERKV
ncbi:Ldh family oxidoreductase [Achromobacter aloeverae]|uniref:Lactate dehydrogenase n=1 Tax=Achromobacter aloeverae TaxID=1750518 RepID=A0A4Q1HEE6_9BURK|nr:Ldh family oxidoreductase [Achromobacter aloeverae]RXN83663.1 lactate dehydrogenase [Achromobacter aloeverae]